MVEINKVYHDDCMKLMPQMENNSVHLTLTDIPYNIVNRKSNGLRKIGYLDKGVADIATFDTVKFIKECIRVTSGSIYVFCSTEEVSDIRKTMVESKMSTRFCALVKTNPAPINAKFIWLTGIECCIYGKKSKATFNEFCKNPVWHYPIVRSKRHPTEKPLKLLEYLIRVSSNEGDVIFDPCAGSGSTLLAAKNMNRNYIGIELHEEYYQGILERLGENSII